MSARACFVVSGTTAPDDVLDVAALVAEVAARSPEVHAVVLATLRPARLPVRAPVGRRDDDVARWLVLLDLFDEVGVELLDWFVVGRLGGAVPAGAHRAALAVARDLSGRRRSARRGRCGHVRAGPALSRGQPQARGP